MLTDSDDIYLIKQEYDFACKLLLIPEDISGKHWRLLEEALKKINRTNVYHNTAHIVYMMNLFDILLISHDQFKSYINIYLLMLAILYHDCIYVVGATDNEERSFEMLKKLLKEGEVEKSKIVYAQEMIMGETEKGLHAKLFKDLDYAIMGEHPLVYRQYTQDIEDEYRQVVEHDVYLNGRYDFLMSSNINNLYETKYLGQIFRHRASGNISSEIGELRTMIGNLESKD